MVVQCLAGLAISLGAFFVMRKYIKQKDLSQVDYGAAQTNIDALRSKRCIVVGDIPAHGVGLVKIGGETWRARSEGDVLLQKETQISVLRVEGNTVIVAPKKTEGDSDGDV